MRPLGIAGGLVTRERFARHPDHPVTGLPLRPRNRNAYNHEQHTRQYPQQDR